MEDVKWNNENERLTLPFGNRGATINPLIVHI